MDDLSDHSSPIAYLGGVVLETRDPRALCAFYEDLLGWQRTADEDDWCKLMPPEGRTGISFQRDPAYERPTWPAAAGAQQMQVHLDFWVGDLAAAVGHAIAKGATLAETQHEDDFRVLVDPDGHLFCVCV